MNGKLMFISKLVNGSMHTRAVLVFGKIVIILT